MSTAVIFLVAVLFLSMGAYGLVAPAALVRPFKIALDGADARAVYCGFGVAISAVLAVAGLDLDGIRVGR